MKALLWSAHFKQSLTIHKYKEYALGAIRQISNIFYLERWHCHIRVVRNFRCYLHTKGNNFAKYEHYNNITSYWPVLSISDIDLQLKVHIGDLKQSM